MKHFKINQKGFSAVEGLLVIIIVLLIGFIGYYVWHTQKQTNKTYNSSANAAQPSTKNPSPKKASPATYMTIKEWGVRAPYSGTLTLEYAVQTASSSALPDTAGFSSMQLDTSSSTCKANDEQNGISAVGIFDRYQSGQEYLIGDDAEDSGQTAAQYAATLSKSDYGHVGNYYYFYTGPQATCATDQASQNVFDQTKAAVKALLPKLQAVPSS